MNKKDEIVWIPYEEYIANQYLMGRVSEEEYQLAMQYIKENTKKDMTFKEWLEKKDKS